MDRPQLGHPHFSTVIERVQPIRSAITVAGGGFAWSSQRDGIRMPARSPSPGQGYASQDAYAAGR